MPFFTFSTTSTSTAESAFAFDVDYIEIRVGPSAPAAPPPLPTPLRDACATLGLTPPLEGWHVVQQRYRELAKQHHPDVAGDPERMKAINAAYDLLREYKPA